MWRLVNELANHREFKSKLLAKTSLYAVRCIRSDSPVWLAKATVSNSRVMHEWPAKDVAL